MTSIKSSIGESNFNSSGRKFSVPGEYSNPIYRQEAPGQQIDPGEVFEIKRKIQEQSKERESKSLKDIQKRVEYLTGIGRCTKEIPVTDDDGNTIVFTLRTLKGFEQNNLVTVMTNADKVPDGDGGFSFTKQSSFSIKYEALCYSLYLIDGQNVDIVFGIYGLDPEEIKEQKYLIISNMDDSFINYLFSKYEELVRETNKKYLPKTTEEVAEVVEAIGKSGQNK